MRVPYFSLFALFGLSLLWAPHFLAAQAPADVRGVITLAANLPNPTLTPGAVLTEDVAKICAPGFGRSARHTAHALKRAIYAEYHVTPQRSRYEIDHLIPLELGGADVRANLWPRSDDTPDARDKDRLADFLRREVCAGHVSLREAQRAIAHDWHQAYRKYLGGF